MHLEGWMVKPININWEVKWSKTRGTKEIGQRCECHLLTKGRDMKEKQQKRFARHENEQEQKKVR